MMHLRLQPLDQMIPHPHRVGDRGQCRINRRGRDEERGVDHVEVVQLVRLAPRIEHRARRVGAEADGPGWPGPSALPRAQRGATAARSSRSAQR